MRRFVIMKKIWIYHYTPKSKTQSVEAVNDYFEDLKETHFREEIGTD